MRRDHINALATRRSSRPVPRAATAAEVEDVGWARHRDDTTCFPTCPTCHLHCLSAMSISGPMLILVPGMLGFARQIGSTAG